MIRDRNVICPPRSAWTVTGSVATLAVLQLGTAADAAIGAALEAHGPAGQTTATTATRQFDNVLYTPPPDWAVRQLDFAVELNPTTTVGQELLVVWILRGRASRATLESELAATWADVQATLGAQEMRNVSGSAFDTTKGRSPLGWEFVHGTGGMRRPDATFTVQVYALRAGDRVERVAVIAREIRENLSVTNASLSPRHSGPLRTLIFSLRFANLPDPKLPVPTLTGGGITGVWAGLGMSSGRIKPEFAIFFSGGVAYFSPRFPTQGLLDLDPYAEQPAQPREWGTWTMTGDTGAMTLPYGSVPLRRLGPVLELTTNKTPHRYVRLSMPPAGRLNGTWCTDAAACLRLTAAGRFQDTGAIRTVEHVTYAYPESPARGEGQYELRDHTLVLRYDGGPALRVAFPGLLADDVSETPQALVLGFAFDVLKRRD